MSESDDATDAVKKYRHVPTRLDIRPMGRSPRIEEFLRIAYSHEGINRLGTSDFSPVGVNVYEQDGFLHLLLLINDDTTGEDLRQVAPLILRLRDRLLEFQGPNTLAHGRTRLYDDFCNLQQANSWATLTTAINELLAEQLRNFSQFLSEVSEADPDEDAMTWLNEKPRYVWSLAGAEQMLRHLGIPGIQTDKDIDHFCSTAVKRIYEGEDPYTAVGQPLTVDHLRNKVRSWQKGKLAQSLRQRRPDTSPQRPDPRDDTLGLPQA